jgi:hypothetical protein
MTIFLSFLQLPLITLKRAHACDGGAYEQACFADLEDEYAVRRLARGERGGRGCLLGVPLEGRKKEDRWIFDRVKIQVRRSLYGAFLCLDRQAGMSRST